MLTMAFLLASYEWCVRYTFIGAILNGRKYRNRTEAVNLCRPHWSSLESELV